ncbi:MAG: STAS domain-containing protein [Oscillospiraceae bacterium]|nr:STAS domain-containing protein [Oscillospiraceae bacterium]MBQ6609205.1 STAS domain-containing protein [Oscillospiraceae bacterium]
MTITKTLNGPECILAVEGRLDAESAPNLRAVVETLDEVSDLTLDFSRLLYISSAGLRVLMIAHRVVGEGGKIRVIHAKDVIRTVLEMTGFAAVLTIEDN